MNRIFTFFMLIVFTFSLSAQTTTTADTSIPEELDINTIDRLEAFK